MLAGFGPCEARSIVPKWFGARLGGVIKNALDKNAGYGKGRPYTISLAGEAEPDKPTEKIRAELRELDGKCVPR